MKPSRYLAAGLLTASLAATTPALAQTATTAPTARSQLRSDVLSTVKARAKAEIDRRLVTLADLTKLVDGARHLSPSDRSTLKEQLSAATSGLSALEAKIEGDNDRQTLVADARQIVTGYRVYLLVKPKVHEVVAADRMLALTELFDRLLARADAKVTSDSDKALLADAKAKVADAKGKAEGVPAAVIDLLPSGYPGNRSVLLSGRQSLQAGRQDLVAARQDLAKLVR